MDRAATYVCRWSQAPLQFTFSCDSGELAERAREVLSCWDSSMCNQRPQIDINCSASRHPDGWEFSGSQLPQSTIYRSIAGVVQAIETDAALAILNHAEHFLTVHGALLARGDDAVLLVGPSHSGKSTTSCALWAAGWQLLGDDLSILDPATAEAFPVLRRISLRHSSKALLDETFWQQMLAANTCDTTDEGYIFHPWEIEGRSRARTVRLRAIVFLQRKDAPVAKPATITALPEVTALLSLSPYTNIIRHHGLGEAMTRLSGIINSVPCYDLFRGPVPAMIETIETLITEPAIAPY